MTKYRRPEFTRRNPTTCTCSWITPPTPALPTLVQRLKGRSAYEVRREFTAACVRARMRGHLWSPSYFAVSCGGAPLAIIKQYIEARPASAPGYAQQQDGLTPD